MGDNEQNITNPVDNQEKSEDETRDERAAFATRRPVEDSEGQTNIAVPADDDIIIK